MCPEASETFCEFTEGRDFCNRGYKTPDEIGEQVGVSQDQVSEELKVFREMASLPKSEKVRLALSFVMGIPITGLLRTIQERREARRSAVQCTQERALWKV
jgi:hypothetical protein